MKKKLYHVILSAAKNPHPVILSAAKNPHYVILSAAKNPHYVILSAAKNLCAASGILRCTQNDIPAGVFQS